VSDAIAAARLGQEYGAFDIDSMPPDTTMSASRPGSDRGPSMVAFMPDPHTLLTVVAPTASGRPAARIAWRAGACALAGGQHATHQDLVHLLRRQIRPLQGSADDVGAERRRCQRRKITEVAPERRCAPRTR